MKPTTFTGDIVNMSSGIICHQVNCKGIMGAGLALQIRKKYPRVYDDYMAAYNADHLKLGHVIISPIKQNLFVASICGQHDYGRDKSKVYTDYVGLVDGLERVFKFANDNSISPIYIPYQMGCGLANGDWYMVVQCMYMISTDFIVIKKSF